jgi:hypothetical protein
MAFGYPPSSSADITAQAQVARDDGANAQAPAPPVQTQLGPDGRIVAKATDAPTNADAAKTTANGNADAGTNDPVVPLTISQSISSPESSGALPNPPFLDPAQRAQAARIASGELPTGFRGFGTGSNNPSLSARNTNQIGVGARTEDAATPKTTNSVVNRLDELYAGAQNAIISQDNVLDQFSSYTYSLSWYVLDHATYNSLLTSDTKYLNNFYLLMQSGGAAIQNKVVANNNTAAAASGFVQAPGELGRGGAGSVGAGRSPFFPLDYYLDNLEFDVAISGTPGTRGAATLSTVSFTVTEPNGISLQANLVRAINDLYWNSGLAKKGITVNYNEAHYVMVIRFYGYDAQGNLVMPIDNRTGSTDRQAIIEKFIPFNITGIEFKVANKLVEYTIKGASPAQLTAFSTDRGSIPQNFQFQGTTVSDILQGKPYSYTQASADTTPLTDTVFGRG